MVTIITTATKDNDKISGGVQRTMCYPTYITKYYGTVSEVAIGMADMLYQQVLFLFQGEINDYMTGF